MITRLSHPDREGRGVLDRYLPALLTVAGVAGAIPVLRSLPVPDLNWCYPYLSSDSYDWINNGLFWAGAPLSPTFRPPGLPLVMAGLYRLGALGWLPVLNVVLLGVTALLLHRLLGERFRPAVAALSAWVFFANGYAQDFSRWVMAEVWAVFCLVLATLFFVRAGGRPRTYVPFGLALGAGFLFHYGAVPAGIGFAGSVLLGRREHLRRLELWGGALAAAGLPAGWLAFRWRYALLHPDAPRHSVEALFRFVPQNLRFYAFGALALLGLLVLPLYVAGALRCLERAGREESLLRTVFTPVLAALGLFFGLLYNWTDKRFLLYLFPFALGFFALGVEGLLAWGRRTPALRVVGGAYLLAALAWNQIAYPPYGIQFLALTPRDFLQASATQDAAQNTSLHLSGARVVRLHQTLPGAFAGGLFDFRLRRTPCALDAPDYASLAELRRGLDGALGRGAPVSLEKVPWWPLDSWAGANRLSNQLLRPLLWLDVAPCRTSAAPAPAPRQNLAAGPHPG
ncbi:MAG TPA: glycosyltransferase family 39 protein, partial [Thermoanaerobaculia bacterium]|nr:glycosyltransferase family 39 protein [Thermoanaerobaculia bacterium]